jgi:HAD superfamily hydrolase (TIGR01509 family)
MLRMHTTLQQPPTIRAVAFDLDGLMFNTEDLYDQVGATILQRRGKKFDADLKSAMMGRPGRVALQIMIDRHGLDATPDDLQRETDELFHEILDRKVQPLPGLWELLDALEHAAIPKAVATSSRRSFTQRVLGVFGLEPRFEFLLTSEDVIDGKPHPEIYLTAARRFQVLPSQMLVLEDSENGCRAAVQAGTFTVAVPSVHSRTHDFRGAAFLADSLADPRIFAALRHRLPARGSA